jgi:CRISPR-associated protein Csb2
MPATLAFRFPLGRYHATPWDRSVNEGATEWPPSPWRLLRALVATWHTRWPEFPAERFDRMLEELGSPPSYRTPPARPGHTRHYLPDPDHRKGETGRTDLTLDPFLWMDRSRRNSGGRDGHAEPGELLVRWEAELDPQARSDLATLAGLVPYLGRADSVCSARLLDDDPVPDETWWRPGADGPRTARLLAAASPVRRAALEVSTVEVRRQRRATPPGTMWVGYGAAESAPRRRETPRAAGVEAVRFAVVSDAPVKRTHAVLLADAVHLEARRRFPGAAGTRIMGYGGAPTRHQHAHWIPLWCEGDQGMSVQSLLVYVPDSLSADEVAKLIGIGEVSGRRGANDYEFHDLPPVRLLFQGAGAAQQVAPELCGPARQWRSLSPYLPVRHWHRNRETLAEYLAADVHAELGYRGLPPAQVRQLDPAAGLPDRWALSFRRYRMKEHLGLARHGLGVGLEFEADVRGPLVLGQLSHFGYGVFVPEMT